MEGQNSKIKSTGSTSHFLKIFSVPPRIYLLHLQSMEISQHQGVMISD